MEKALDAPSQWRYVIGAAVLIIGIVASAVFFFTQISGIAPDIRFVVPGTHEIYFDEGGKYTVFYEYRSVIDNKVYSTGESLSGMLAKLESKEDSREIVLSAPSGSSTYETGGRAGTSVLKFEIEEPGTYVFTADYEVGRTGPQVVFAIGQFELLGTILKGLGIFFGGLIIGGFIVVRTFLKRRKAGKRMVGDLA